MTFSISVFLCIVVFCLLSLLLKINPWLKLLLAIGIPIYLFGVISFIGTVIAVLIFSALFFIPNFIQALLYFGLFYYMNQNLTWWMYIIAFALSFPIASFFMMANSLIITPVFTSLNNIYSELVNQKPRRIPSSTKEKEDYFQALENVQNTYKLFPDAKVDASYYPELETEYQEWKSNQNKLPAISNEIASTRNIAKFEEIKMNLQKRRILALCYLVAIFPVFIYVPWQKVTRINPIILKSDGYRFIWEQVDYPVSIDFSRISLEFIAVSIVFGIIYVLFKK